jgi:predicted extracellular nuclease
MKNKILFTGLIVLIGLFSVGCGSKSAFPDSNKKINVELSCVAFYNLENLFDTINSPNTNDTEYTPNGANKWNTHKYNSKLKRMSYAISQIGLDYSPIGAAIIGVSEVENRTVLEDLVKQPDIANRSYEIVHYDSPDRRGIDVALLYNPRLFVVSNTKAHPYYMEENPNFVTRDQLLVSGYLQNEKIHVIVNHWPSRYGGEVASRPNRMAAAKVTKSIVDSLQRTEPNAKIIIMGDLNDDPSNVSVAETLGAKKNAADVTVTDLYNTLWTTHDKGIGSLAYQGQWNLFDQIIISAPLVNAERTALKFWKAEVFNRSFLTNQEGQDKGTPKRTHSRGVWLDGYSDHYPTLIYLVKEAQ